MTLRKSPNFLLVVAKCDPLQTAQKVQEPYLRRSICRAQDREGPSINSARLCCLPGRLLGCTPLKSTLGVGAC